MINVSYPAITEADCLSVLETLRASRLSQGEMVQKFEEGFAAFTGASYAVACNNGTSALHLALLALGIKAGDEVLVPDLTYISTANVVRYVGALPIFVDVRKDTWNIDLDKASAYVSERTKAIIPVHLYGVPCDMDALEDFAALNNLLVVEDAAEALGASWKQKHCGTWGDCGCFSFFANKIMTTGEGGMVITQDDRIARRLRLFRGQGQGSRRYVHDVVGYNYRMTDMQGALGVSQLTHLETSIEKRRKVCEAYQAAQVLQSPQDENTAPWLYTGLVPEGFRDKIADALLQRGIETRPVFVPMHAQPIYNWPPAGYTNASYISANGLSLPTHPFVDPKAVLDTYREVLDGMGIA